MTSNPDDSAHWLIPKSPILSRRELVLVARISGAAYSVISHGARALRVTYEILLNVRRQVLGIV